MKPKLTEIVDSEILYLFDFGIKVIVGAVRAPGIGVDEHILDYAVRKEMNSVPVLDPCMVLLQPVPVASHVTVPGPGGANNQQMGLGVAIVPYLSEDTEILLDNCMMVTELSESDLIAQEWRRTLKDKARRQSV